ncbi:HBR440Cp [Eremothecium sinecaudum]|uniref:HBR440Cp n=1 Tax=Eremothecium sinecaudum TaxID=45286 RepID=A0A109UVK0_9SACH|nr:HBR440Cp [Eremothecium sinecaudum]AMD19341.1 HBR440Cp [Eremothecium sinecaudum]
MAFLKRLNVASHSRSSSNSSNRASQSSGCVGKTCPNKVHLEASGVRNEYLNRNAKASESGGYDALSDVGQHSAPLSPSEANVISKDDIMDTETRVSIEKTVYPWDVTDPEQWTMHRVKTWLKEHDFDEQWVSFFRKNHIYGKNFLQLLAKDNFSKHENFLSTTKNSSYERFQYLLKRTLEDSVTCGHKAQRSTIVSDARNSFDSISRHMKRLSGASDQRSGHSDCTYSRKAADIGEERYARGRTHQKARSTGAIYRRSFISLRSLSSNNRGDHDDRKPLPIVTLNIPPRPFSTIENTPNSSPTSTLKLQQSPLSPVNGQIFNRTHKSSSSDSSLFNSKSYNEDMLKVSNCSSPQNECPSQKRLSDVMHSPLRLSPWHMDDRSKFWDKLKKITHSGSDQCGPSRYKALSNIRGTGQQISTLQEYSDENLPSATSASTAESFYNVNQPQVRMPKLEDKYHPVKTPDFVSQYVLVSKDNKAFLPLPLGSITTSKDLREEVSSLLDIKSDFTFHLTDFGCQPGEPLPADVMSTLRDTAFINSSWKLYVNCNVKPKYSQKAAELVEGSVNTKAFPSKNSLKSTTSSVVSSNDDMYSFTDITSIDEHGNVTGRREYPKTPSHYYDQGSAIQSPEVDYWNIKDKLPDLNSSISTARVRSNSKTAMASGSSLDDLKKQSFKVIRKHSNTEIDFNKGRASPYVRPELAPKRDAPKPPYMGSQISLASVHSVQSGATESVAPPISPGKPNRQRTVSFLKKVRPPPPAVDGSISVDTKVTISTPENSTPTDSIVPSYTPATSHVLVPKPYKGKLPISDGEPDEQKMTTAASISRNHRTRRSYSLKTSSLPTRVNSTRLVSSTSAADIFDENEISFAGAPELSDFDSEGSVDSDDIIWSFDKSAKDSSTTGGELERANSAADTTLSSDVNEYGIPSRKMTLRPTAEVVYQNLEMFFPDTDLDKPILEGLTPSASPAPSIKSPLPTVPDRSVTPSPSSSVRQLTPRPFIANNNSNDDINQVDTVKSPRRTRTIRAIAREASEARKQRLVNNVKRHNTKMWGTKVVEITDKRTVSINKAKNSKGEYKEFAWIKGELIGKGSFGAVYLGLNVTTGEMMAVKQVEVPKFGSQGETAACTVNALISEVSTLRNLDHLNIVQYLGFENKNGIYSLFLEYVAGGSIGSLFRLYGHFDEQLIRFLTRQVLEGLAYLHLRGILHRDLKADNILLDNAGVCKISDFGISRQSNNIYSNSEMTMRGTVFWMAPEMVDTTQGYSAKVDIWSLGCVVLEMFAGRRPWSNFEAVAAMFQIGKSKAAPPIPEDTLPLISQEGRDFLDNCFKVDPEERPTADKLLSHPFCQVPPEFDFAETDLLKFIKQNDKLNNSKLRINSHE